MITPELKDDVLKTLVQSFPAERMINFNPAEMDQLNFDELHAILRQFEKRGLITDLNARRSIIHLCVTVEAIDF